jgi:hypothetical protein
MPEEQTEMSEVVRYEILKMIRDLATGNKASTSLHALELAEAYAWIVRPEQAHGGGQ